MRIPIIALPLGLAAMALACGAGAAQEIGAAGAVNPATAGTPPGRPTRVIELGARVIHKERIQTTSGGSVQLIFLDKTTLNVGPNSDLVIDEFIYDPSRGAGQMAVSMTKGVLRFVGGNISHAGNASVKTPAATLGIRGGVATIKHQPCGVPPAAGQGLLVPDAPCGTRAINHFGVMTVSTAVGTEIIRRPASRSRSCPAPRRCRRRRGCRRRRSTRRTSSSRASPARRAARPRSRRSRQRPAPGSESRTPASRRR